MGSSAGKTNTALRRLAVVTIPSIRLAIIHLTKLSLNRTVVFIRGTRWRSGFRRRTTSRKVAGSISDYVNGIFFIDIILPRLRWSSGWHAGLWYPRSRVLSRRKNPQHAFLGGEVKPSPMSQICGGKQWQPTPKKLPRMQCARAIPVA